MSNRERPDEGMRISAAIVFLQDVLEKHGDLILIDLYDGSFYETELKFVDVETEQDEYKKEAMLADKYLPKKFVEVN